MLEQQVSETPININNEGPGETSFNINNESPRETLININNEESSEIKIEEQLKGGPTTMLGRILNKIKKLKP